MIDTQQSPMNWGDPRLPERFWSKCIPEPNSGCWLWTGATNRPDCYGHFSIDGRLFVAHRVSFIASGKSIAIGLELDHLCRVRCCVNPDHLEPVSHRENGLRGISRAAMNAKKTSCLRGHPFDDSNTAIDSRGNRWCRTCNIERMRRRRHAIRRHGAVR